LNKTSDKSKFSIPPQTSAFLMALGLFMATMTVLRFVFMILNWDTFSSASVPELSLSFLIGSRFDLHVILSLIGVFFLALHVPGSRRAVPVFARKILWLPLFLFLPVIALSILNMHYYSEAGRHLSYEVSFVMGEFSDLMASMKMIAQYRLSMVILLLLSIVLIVAWRMILNMLWNTERTTGTRVEIIWLTLYLFFFILGLRGSVVGRPIRMSHAFVQGRIELGHLALNPQFTVSRSLVESEEKIPAFYTEKEAVETVRKLLASPGTTWHGDDAPLYRKSPASRKETGVKYNVVLIVLESWSSRYVGAYGNDRRNTPEFDALATEGILFKNFYATGSRTDEGLASLCLGIPSFNRLHNPGKGSILSGALEQNRYAGLGSVLGENGYSTVYLHGESSKTFRQASLARLAGFQKHLGSEELDLTPDETSGPWGGWDHVLLEKLLEILRKEKEPFAVLWISLSNHLPYTLPDDTFKKAQADDLDGKFMDSIRYTDHHLGLFFDKVRNEDFFDRTIFVITADHSARVITSMEDRYSIPLLFYAPGFLKPYAPRRTGSQVDLIPTVLNLLGLESYHHAMGSSLFEEGTEGFAFLNFSSGYGWVSGGDLVEIGPDGGLLGIRTIGNAEGAHGRAEVHRRKLLSYLQIGRKMLLENRFMPVP
jgi:phosphoglycerol transferase MdoB-like AlkP superfamily enzyme